MHSTGVQFLASIVFGPPTPFCRVRPRPILVDEQNEPERLADLV